MSKLCREGRGALARGQGKIGEILNIDEEFPKEASFFFRGFRRAENICPKTEGNGFMKIKLAILESDQNYLNRIVSVFSTRYADKFQIYSFTNQEMALEAIDAEKIDVLVANDSFEIDVRKLPARCSFVYFVNSADVDTVKDQKAICKFQKAELIYKQILSVYSENAGSFAGLKLTDDDCKVTIFVSPSGGVGTSTVAVAYAVHLARQGKRPLFLSFEDFGSTDFFFAGEGQFDMSDVIFALKSKKANLAMKLESYVKQDVRGVFFFSQAKFALDMLEFKHEERLQLLNELRLVGAYDEVVVDLGFALDKEHFDYYKKANNVVIVGDGTENSNIKIYKAYTALSTMDQNSEVPVANRFSLIYNRFSSTKGRSVEGIDLRSIGGAPVYANAKTSQIVEQLAAGDMFNKLG